MENNNEPVLGAIQHHVLAFMIPITNIIEVVDVASTAETSSNLHVRNKEGLLLFCQILPDLFSYITTNNNKPMIHCLTIQNIFLYN
jgi:hypothetical protein